MSQASLAKRIGVSRQTIVNYESGTAGISMENLARLAQALGVEETDLVAAPHSSPATVYVQPSVREAWRIVDEALQSLPKTAVTFRKKKSRRPRRISSALPSKSSKSPKLTPRKKD